MIAETTWRDIGRDLQRREYGSYDEYVAHQQAKLQGMGLGVLARHEQRYVEALVPRLAATTWPRGTAVLCLGARGGAEVRAFLSLGCVAIGIDLNPGPANPYVLPGDFHDLLYGDGTVGVVFTNALDHCYDLNIALMEVGRVLVPEGCFVVEAVRGTREGCAPAEYESLTWPTIDALVQVIEARGFVCTHRTPFDCPWPGEHLVFRLGAA